MPTSTIREPSSRAPVVDKADYVEFCALTDADHRTSLAEYVGDLRRSGSIEVMDEAEADEDQILVDPGGEDSEALADEVSVELDEREASCGGTYPFTVGVNTLEAAADATDTPYVFMLLLSMFGDCGPDDINVTKLFEDMAEEAALSYFGGPGDQVFTYPFGAPRRKSKTSFAEAVDELCVKLGEGGGLKPQLNLADQQDGKLDLVVWRRFPDRRSGQLIGFGQCATGANWKEKVTELKPDSFCKSWMRDAPVIFPTALFFVPFRIDKRRWQTTSYDGGIIFDRCRIVHHLNSASATVIEQCAKWSKFVLNEKGLS
jgi:hypothetical protein